MSHNLETTLSVLLEQYIPTMEVPEETSRMILSSDRANYRLIVESSQEPRMKEYLMTGKGDYRTFDRLRQQAPMKYSLCFHKTKISSVRFAVSAGEDMCNFAYAYGEGLNLSFFACGGNFSSQDGEYRSQFNTLEIFEKLIYAKFGELFSIAEDIVLERLESQEIQIHITAYPRSPATRADVVELNKLINETRLAIKLLALCVLVDLPDIYLGLAPNHINPLYSKIIAGDGKSSYDRLLAQMGPDVNYSTIRYYFYGHSGSVRVGQKLAPLTAGELANMDNILYDAWREIYVATICTNHVMNSRCSSFPCIGNWFLVNTQDVDFYDNPMMRKKFMDSDVSQDIIRQITDLQSKTVGTGPTFRSDAFKETAKYINDAIINAKENIALSDYSTAVMSEYVGLTLRDWYHHVNHEIPVPALRHAYHDQMGVSLTDKLLFKDRLWELVYALRTLNESWILHTDLHTNNMTLMRAIQPPVRPREMAYTLYCVNGAVYKLPVAMLTFMIIDYSRCILGDTEKITAEFGETVARELHVMQKPKMLYLVHCVFPEFTAKHFAKIDSLIDSDTKMAFKVLSTLDVCIATSNIATLLDTNAAYKSKYPFAAEFARTVNAAARKLSLENLVNWVSGKLPTLDEFEWPNTHLLRSLWPNRELSWDLTEFKDPLERRQRCLPEHATLIVDVFNYNNPQTLDVGDFNKWGPLNLTRGTQMIRDVLPDYFDHHTACVFERAKDPQWDEDIIKLAASYKVDNPFAVSAASMFSEVG